MHKYIFTLAAVVMTSCGGSDVKSPENERSYEAWMGSTYSQQVSFAGGHYYKTSENITEDERSSLIENNMAGLNLRGAKLVDCSLEITPPEFDKNGDYFTFIITHCMDKMAM